MNHELCEKLAGFCGALFAVATCTTAGVATSAVGGAAAALMLPSVFRRLRRTEATEPRAVISAWTAKIEADWPNWVRAGEYADGTIEPSFAALETVLPLLDPSPEAVMKAGRNRQRLVADLLDAASEASEEFSEKNADPQAGINRGVFARVLSGALESLWGQEAIEAKLQEWFQRDVLDKLDTLIDLFGDRLREQSISLEQTKIALAEAEVSLESARSFLEFMLEKKVSPDQFPAALIEATANWARANPDQDRAFAGNLFPSLEGLRDEARQAYENSEIARFYDLRRRIREETDRAYRDLKDQMDAAEAVLREDLDEEREAAIAAFNAEGAARAIARQTELELPEGASQFGALRKVHREWLERGRDKGLNLDLEVSIHLADAALACAAGADERGASLDDLGNALQTLGERESGTARLEEAVAAYRAALEEGTRDRVPLDWATTQNNLGNALRTLGARESGTARLEEAVAAHRAALEERTRDRVPLDWAMSQSSLGSALLALGERESGTTRLEEAVVAFRAALEEMTRDRVPFDWAMTQSNLGAALQTLGARESGTKRLEEAVAAYRAALEESTRERVPLIWAGMQNNLGNALRTLGERESGTLRLVDAIAAYRDALQERTRDLVPLKWAMTQSNLGGALAILAMRESGTGRFEEAVSAFRAALEEWTRERTPFDWARTQENLAMAYWGMFRIRGVRSDLEAARTFVVAALEVYREAKASYCLSKAESLLAEIRAAGG